MAHIYKQTARNKLRIQFTSARFTDIYSKI